MTAATLFSTQKISHVNVLNSVTIRSTGEKSKKMTPQHSSISAKPNGERNLPTNNQSIIDMKNLDEKRAREIADRLEEIRRETNSCSVHNTKPLSKERLLELYSEENELIEEYRDLWKAKKRS